MNYSESEFKEMVKQTLNELDDCKAKWSMKKDKKREQSVIISATQVINVSGLERIKITVESSTNDREEEIKSAVLAVNKDLISCRESFLKSIDKYVLG
jgi:fructose-1-phosphate kinase PfkB-like protein